MYSTTAEPLRNNKANAAITIQQRLQPFKQTLLVTQRGHSKNTKDAYLPRSDGHGRTSAQHNIPGALLHSDSCKKQILRPQSNNDSNSTKRQPK